MLLMTALTAGSAIARLHGHDRRHAHPKDAVELNVDVEQPAVTAAPEKRGVGAEVVATIDGQLVSWINEWSGQQSSESSPETESTAAPTTTATPTAAATTSEAAAVSSVSATPVASSSSSSSSSNWADYPADGDYTTTGFGASTASKRVGSLDWDYIGNVGNPWGSNIIQVSEDSASGYKHVLRFENDNSKAWTVVMWNSYGPSGGLNGFWSPNKALSFTVEPNESVFVAIDDDSQGGWGAAEGEDLPTNYVGEYASTWGEFDMSNSQNDGYSGWDVSCIIAELANMDIAGMQICNHAGEKCSSITKGAGATVNAYTSADQGKNDKAVAQSAGPVRLVVNLGWSS
jgi:Na+-translocating ferredoxin:NAD+ oxidoreductase RnfG subunit